MLPDFSRFPADSDDYLNAFFTDPRHGRYCGRYVPGAIETSFFFNTLGSLTAEEKQLERGFFCNASASLAGL